MRSGVSRVRVSRVSIRVRVRVKFMAWLRGEMSGKGNVQGKCLIFSNLLLIL